jgi:prepilin-type processing-associated H-X9-DG protein
MNLHKLREPPAETLVCGDGNEIGMKTFSIQFRQGYTGEYADPIWRHLSTTPTPENRDQGWWATPYGDGPPADLQPRGNGRANFGFLDGHVTSMTEAEIRDRWEDGLINYEIR